MVDEKRAANGTNGIKKKADDVQMGSWPSSDKTDGAAKPKKEHLVVMVHGLFGSHKHLDAMVKAMKTQLATRDDVEIFVSKKNGGIKTLDGIQKCGDRLLAELEAFLSDPNAFKTISFVGHSMGGLIIRYAIGHKYDADKSTIFGLVPLHFIAITTPHFGCNDAYLSDIKNEDSVTPCLRWMGQCPVVGKVPAFLFHVFESFFVWLVLRKTGDQLFLRDKKKIIEQLASYSFKRDSDKTLGEVPPPYLAALSSFRERTCYGNIRGDHVVAWENATVRRKIDLPKIKRKDAPYGIVNEEVSPRTIDHELLSPHGDGPITRSPTMATCPKIELMIRNLEQLGWRRVDVKTKILIHKGAPWAHDNIISKNEGHDNFKVVALHSTALLLNTITKYEEGTP